MPLGAPRFRSHAAGQPRPVQYESWSSAACSDRVPTAAGVVEAEPRWVVPAGGWSGHRRVVAAGRRRCHGQVRAAGRSPPRRVLLRGAHQDNRRSCGRLRQRGRLDTGHDVLWACGSNDPLVVALARRPQVIRFVNQSTTWRGTTSRTQGARRTGDLDVGIRDWTVAVDGQSPRRRPWDSSRWRPCGSPLVGIDFPVAVQPVVMTRRPNRGRAAATKKAAVRIGHTKPDDMVPLIVPDSNAWVNGESSCQDAAASFRESTACR